MRNFFFIGLLLFALCSCSISGEILKNREYTKEEFDYSHYKQDRYQCEQDSYLYAAPVAHDGGLIHKFIAADRRVSRFEECMRIKGYYRIK